MKKLEAKILDLKARLLEAKILEAAQADDSPMWPRAQLIMALERLIVKYEQLDKSG